MKHCPPVGLVKIGSQTRHVNVLSPIGCEMSTTQEDGPRTIMSQGVVYEAGFMPRSVSAGVCRL